MKNFKKILLIGVGCLALVAVVGAMVVKYNASLVNEAGLSYSKNYPLPLNQYQVDNLSFVSIASSVTFTAETFIDGQQSTGTITVASNTGISTTSASMYLTVLSTQNLKNLSAVITINGISIYQNLDWFQDVTVSSTAISISKAINSHIPGVVSSTGGVTGIVYATATTPGSFGNNMSVSINISTQVISLGAVNTSVMNFSGGSDGALLTIGARSYIAGLNYAVGASANATAINLANAINSSSNTYFVQASTSGAGAIVSATSTVVGAFTNWTITSSTQAALTIGGSTVTVQGLNGKGIGQMWGGLDSAYTLASGSATVINVVQVATANWTTGLEVLYSTSSGVGITGLVWGTTYYVIPQPTGNAISLSLTSTGAIAGLAITLTSSTTKSATDTFVLTPLAITGTPAYSWQVSNDGVNWIPFTATDRGIAVASRSLSAYVSTGTVDAWDFGSVGYSYIRLAVTGPTTGAIKLQVIGNGKNTSN